MAKKELKPGEELQILVHALERAIHSNPAVKIESPKLLPDKDTGRPREHDVILTFQLGHHELVQALECRDRTRKVGVPDVEQFASKCQRTGVHRGVIVSSKGFAKSALTKAAALEIGCLTLEEAAGFDWCLAPGVEMTTHDLVGVPHWEVETALPFVGSTQIYDATGPIDAKKAGNIAFNALQQRPREVAEAQDQTAVSQPVRVAFDNQTAGSFYLIDSQGTKVPLTRMIIHVVYTARRELVPFSFRQYVDVAKGNGLSNVAYAAMNIGGVSGNIVLHQEDVGVRMSFVPNPAAPVAAKPSKAKSKPPKRRKK